MQNRTGRIMDRRWLWILIPCAVILLLQLTELFLYNRYGLELRTAQQMVKGCCVWFLAPLLMIVGFYQLYSDHGRRHMGGALSGILVILVCCIAYARAGIYFYEDEYKKEAWTEDGFLIDTSGETAQGAVYEPAYGIFRIPFSGWNRERMQERLQAQYGICTEIVGDAKGEFCICTADSRRTGIPPFYFQVKNDYWLNSNFENRLMAVNASVFWKTRNRFATLAAHTGEESLELSDEITGMSHAADDTRYLNIRCISEKDIPSCAADLADWYVYAKEDDRYFRNGELSEDSCLKRVCLLGEETVFVEFPELSRWLTQFSWLELKEAIEKILTEQYPSSGQGPSEEGAGTSTESVMTDEGTEISPEGRSSGEAAGTSTEGGMTDEEWAVWFLENYDTEYYEKECSVLDGTVSYRMVCVDAALGHRMYALLKSTDSGASWQVQSRDPFNGQMGMGINFTFLTEEYGFASLDHNGGDEADLYVTEDGGKSFQICVLQGVGAELEDGYYYNPYDYPEMPYEENGRLYVLCGQGEDGDYEGGDAAGMALFESKDHGHTFLYQGIRETK